MFPRPTARDIDVSSAIEDEIQEHDFDERCDCPGCVVSRIIFDCPIEELPQLIITLGRGLAATLVTVPPDLREAWTEHTLSSIQAAVDWQVRGPQPGARIN